MKKSKAMTNYQRYNYWKAASLVQLPNGRAISKVSTIALTLQFPVTSTGWTRMEETLKFEEPGCLLTLLALTPYEPDDAQAS